MAKKAAESTRLSRSRFDELFNALKNWDRWGRDDRIGALNYITPERVRIAVSLIRSGQRISLAAPIGADCGIGTLDPVQYHIVRHHNESSRPIVSLATDNLCISSHGNRHTHVDALCHVAYRGLLYGGKRPKDVFATGMAADLDVDLYSHGLVARGLLLDAPLHRDVPWLQPGEAVTAEELDRIVERERVQVSEGDVVLLRTGRADRHAAARGLHLRDAPALHERRGRPGLHINAAKWFHDYHVAALLADGDGEAIPSTVDGIRHPVHALLVTAMGMLLADNLDLDGLSTICRQERRWEFLVVGLPLRLRGGTGSLWNVVAFL